METLWREGRPCRYAGFAPADIDCAWAAGFLDGEGWFGVQHGTPAIEAAQVATDAPLRKLREMFGGSIRFHERSRSHRWRLHSAIAARMAMPLLIPFLTVKREQGELLLMYACMVPARGERTRGLSADEREARHELALQISRAKGSRCRISMSSR